MDHATLISDKNFATSLLRVSASRESWPVAPSISLADSPVSDSAWQWSVEGGKLCVGWRLWDGADKLCYAIAGKGRNYSASGANGLLKGSFMLSK